MKNKLLNTYKLKKHFKKGLTPLLCALTVFNICAINVSASAFDVNVPFVEPSIPEYGGYINVYGDWGYGNYIRTYVIAYYPYHFYTDLETDDAQYGSFYEFNNVNVYVDSTSVTLTISALHNYESYSPSGYVTLYRLGNNGRVQVLETRFLNDPTSWSYTDTYTNIVAWQPKGNILVRESSVNTGNSINVIWGDDRAILDSISSVETIINSVYSRLGSIGSDISDIKNALNSGNSNPNIQDVSSSGITNVENKENALIGSNVSTNDLNVSINPNAASVVWGLIDDLTTSNAKVFGMFISILTIAVIGLILNR